MNVIFLTVSRMNDIRSRGIYTDLMRKFRDEGHHVYIVAPVERRYKQPTSLKEEDGISILQVKTLNIQKTNVIEKGLGILLLEEQFKRTINKFFKDISFDLILYSTPPITLNKVITFLKRKNPLSVSYLLLKDIFPQNAVDLGMFSQNSLFYKIFRKKEVQLYRNSDFIGCMSPANVDFVLRHNSFLNRNKVEIAPNSLELSDDYTGVNRNEIREKYHLPVDKPIFIYGGNLGKPQGIDFLIKCLEQNKERTDCHFLIVGNGTEYSKLADWYACAYAKSISLLNGLPKNDYDKLVQSCDVGLIFLDHRFLIPNYPSRLLSYLEYKMPIIAATDLHTDIGRIAEENGYGYWCESVNPDNFTACVNLFVGHSDKIKSMGEKGYQFLLNNYLIKHTYQAIIKHLQ
ncbi:glycosyltransferase family 4 protein [Bacteroides togonis]|uniref:glycosyltransferase family 4 protein n=1 Tax=Bacteroides togonis TaxID=1917883 RepID=UPI00094B304F|nr:glycosyltransferase family 4 protein [Bacteroides togonis]